MEEEEEEVGGSLGGETKGLLLTVLLEVGLDYEVEGVLVVFLVHGLENGHQ